MRAARRPVAILLSAALLGALAGCRSRLAFEIPQSRPAPADQLAPPEAAALREAVAALEGGAARAALARLSALAEVHPESVLVGRWLEEAQLAAARAAGEPEPAGRLRREWRERAEASPTPALLLLAARLEDDTPAALRLIDRALARAPENVWAHYARAWVTARSGDWSEAEASLQEALARDPGHLPARRLEAWLLARAGRTAEAAALLSAWLERAPDSLFVSHREVEVARLDLVLDLLHLGRNAQAARRLAEVDEGAVVPWRRLSARAALLQAEGRLLEALACAREARDSDPQAILPRVQEALLLERDLGDPEGARQAWRGVLTVAAGRDDLGALLQRARAQVHLERLGRKGEGTR